MAEEIWREPSTDKFLEGLAQAVFGRPKSESIKADICLSCGGAATEFSDALSRREYSISGFCQQCQDDFFGEEME